MGNPAQISYGSFLDTGANSEERTTKKEDSEEISRGDKWIEDGNY